MVLEGWEQSYDLIFAPHPLVRFPPRRTEWKKEEYDCFLEEELLLLLLLDTTHFGIF
jgi:hypothetical protein